MDECDGRHDVDVGQPPDVWGASCAGCLSLPVLLLIVPLCWWFLLIPLSLTPLASLAYIAASLATCAGILASTDRSGEPPKTFVATFALLMVLAIGIGTCGFLFDQVIGRFGATFTEAELPSPDGDLDLVHEYVDQGALGGFSIVYVHGRFIPGLLDWRYVIGDSEYPHELGWIDSETATIDNQAYRLPKAVVWLSW